MNKLRYFLSENGLGISFFLGFSNGMPVEQESTIDFKALGFLQIRRYTRVHSITERDNQNEGS